MKLYHLINTETSGYDTYSDMVIAANTEEDAVHVSKVKTYMYSEWPNYPESKEFIWKNYYDESLVSGCWAVNPKVILIADQTTEPEGVVCSSFHAG